MCCEGKMPLPPLQFWTIYEFSVAEISDHLEGNPSGTQKTRVSFFTISKQWKTKSTCMCFNPILKKKKKKAMLFEPWRLNCLLRAQKHFWGIRNCNICLATKFQRHNSLRHNKITVWTHLLASVAPFFYSLNIFFLITQKVCNKLLT